jgi:hypothetical protein
MSETGDKVDSVAKEEVDGPVADLSVRMESTKVEQKIFAESFGLFSYEKTFS